MEEHPPGLPGRSAALLRIHDRLDRAIQVAPSAQRERDSRPSPRLEDPHDPGPPDGEEREACRHGHLVVNEDDEPDRGGGKRDDDEPEPARALAGAEVCSAADRVAAVGRLLRRLRLFRPMHRSGSGFQGGRSAWTETPRYVITVFASGCDEAGDVKLMSPGESTAIGPNAQVPGRSGGVP